MPFDIGPLELTLVLVIVAMVFGVGKLPEVFGAVGKGIREFRKELTPEHKPVATQQVEQPVESSPVH
jgi:sec-independent protein translocase protein TatA